MGYLVAFGIGLGLGFFTAEMIENDCDIEKVFFEEDEDNEIMG